jgi:hypothetical protein
VLGGPYLEYPWMNGDLHYPAQLAEKRVSRSAPTIYSVLAERACEMRSGALSRLVLGAVGGALMVLAIAPTWWLITLPAISVASFGAWGLLARTTENPSRLEALHDGRWIPLLRISKLVVASLGTTAAAVFLTGAFLFCFTGHSASPYGSVQSKYTSEGAPSASAARMLTK